jgi:hypothetical protein
MLAPMLAAAAALTASDAARKLGPVRAALAYVDTDQNEVSFGLVAAVASES